MSIPTLSQCLAGNEYPGRGIIMGCNQSGTHGVMAYFIMGRSENSRNRIFLPEEDGLVTAPYDAAKMTDPSLIIYHPVRMFGAHTVVTNGDQTDTIVDYLRKGFTFAESLRTRGFEPDAPNYTPRISGLFHYTSKSHYKLSILKCDHGDPSAPQRFFFEYACLKPGLGHLIHTYQGNGEPLPSYEGEPKRISIQGSIDDFTQEVWSCLHPENRVSLYVKYVDLSTGAAERRIINRHGDHPKGGQA